MWTYINMLQCLSWLWWTIRNYVFYTRLRTYTLEYVCIFLHSLDGIGALGFIRWVSPLNTWESKQVEMKQQNWDPIKDLGSKNWHPGFQWHLHMHPQRGVWHDEWNQWLGIFGCCKLFFLDSLISPISRIDSTGIQCFGPLNQSNAMFQYIYII